MWRSARYDPPPEQIDKTLQSMGELNEAYGGCNTKHVSSAETFIHSAISKEYARVSKNSDVSLIWLKLCGNSKLEETVRLQNYDILHLCQKLLKYTCISALDLRFNNLSDEGGQYLADYLKVDKLLVILNLTGNDITSEGLKPIAEAIKDDNHIRQLYLAGNPIGEVGSLALARALQVNSTLEVLDISRTDQTIKSVIAFTTILRRNTSLKLIGLNGQLKVSEGEEATVLLGEMLPVNDDLRELHWAQSDVKDFGASRIADALAENTTLQLLNLSSNRIAWDGASALAAALAHHTSLQVLDLAYNRIQCGGARALANALKTNIRLKVLAVQFCEIKSDGLCALAESLFTNQTLITMYIWGNKFDKSSSEAFTNLITTGRLEPDNTDIRSYTVDGQIQMAKLSNDCPHRLYMLCAPFDLTRAGDRRVFETV